MKTKIDKKMNQIVKQINKKMFNDVFKNCFYFQQVSKKRIDNKQYYLYKICDNIQTEREAYLEWITPNSCLIFSAFYELANDFIVKSDFWARYFNNSKDYDKNQDTYLSKRGEN